MDVHPIQSHNGSSMQYLPQATGQQQLPLPRIRSILADASASTTLQLALWSLDGQLLVAAGDASFTFLRSEIGWKQGQDD